MMMIQPNDIDIAKEEIALIGEIIKNLKPFDSRTRKRIIEYVGSWHNSQCEYFLKNMHMSEVNDDSTR